MENFKNFKLTLRKPGSGGGYIFLTGLAAGLIILIQIVILAVIISNGIGYYWPSNVQKFNTSDGKSFLGILRDTNENSTTGKTDLQIKIANRDFYGLDHKRLETDQITSTETPENVVIIERLEYGDFIGFLGETKEEAEENFRIYQSELPRVNALKEESEEIRDKIKSLNLENQVLNYKLIRLKESGGDSEKIQIFENRFQKNKELTNQLIQQNNKILAEYKTPKITIRDVNGKTKEMDVAIVHRIYFPNQINFFDKVGIYFSKFIELISENPREANTEGGIFPAIFGTVVMVFIMSIFSFPLGVIAAIYLRVYAKDSHFLKIVRIAVNNLAGIPSIVFGVFGLGFFIYGLGAGIDNLFFSERLPNPTFGTGGILWSSLTLGLLTVPVVIVATEEALSSIPRGIYEASVSLGATKLQTLLKVMIPIASPGMLTGFILAMSRAAGEVAPLMITGVVKLTPNLVIDGTFPYFHPERKFMHLGFHIFDLGFQSPNVEAAKPMVYITTMLLIVIVLVMTAFAIRLREKLKRKYTFKSF